MFSRKKQGAIMKTVLLLVAFIITFNTLASQQEGFIESAYNAIIEKNYPQAITNYTKLIENQPNYAPAYYGRGLAYFYMDNLDKTMSDFQMAIDIDKNYNEAYYGLGIVYSKKKNSKEAINHFTTAIRLNSNYALAYYARGIAYYELDELDNRAIEIDPNYGLAYYGRAVVHKLQNRKSLALADFDKYLELNGNRDGLAEEVQRLIKEIKELKR